MQHFVITGTDTGAGKTVFAAALTSALGAAYWKPIQAGLNQATDSETVSYLADLPKTRLLPELYRFKAPCSPHYAAEMENKIIDTEKLVIPAASPLVIEGAGGVLVPLTRNIVYADIFARWGMPVILVSRTALGTINHTLLSFEALRCRHVDIMGVVFNGEENPDTERTICEMGRVRHLGRLPFLDPLTPKTLQSAFATGFDPAVFTSKKVA